MSDKRIMALRKSIAAVNRVIEEEKAAIRRAEKLLEYARQEQANMENELGSLLRGGDGEA